jgi:hypothetical protein
VRRRREKGGGEEAGEGQGSASVSLLLQLWQSMLTTYSGTRMNNIMSVIQFSSLPLYGTQPKGPCLVAPPLIASTY